MTKARLIKRQEIKEVEEHKEAGLKEEKKEKKDIKDINEGPGDKLGLMLGAKLKKRQDPRKAFADLFAPIHQ